jgi:uncharacterized protein
MTVSPDSTFAKRLRGFGPIGIVAIIIVLAGSFFVTLLGALLVLVWVWLSDTPWREMGFVRPKSWVWTVIIGVAFGVAFKLVMKTIVMPLLGGPAINPAYHYLAGNSAALPGMLFTVIVIAGFGEEVLFRSYTFERLGKLLGSSAWTKALIILVTSALFGLAHYTTQGVSGVEQALMTGLAFGTIFAVTESIFLPMILHAAFDLAAVAIIYYDVEAAFAHFFFK